MTLEHSYLLEQLNFYSDLALGRNYLWKRVLDLKFPITFFSNQIAEPNLLDGFYIIIK